MITKTTYSTSQVAAAIGIHPNTVRLYEDLELISKPERKPNGYRIFTDLHMEQFRIARLAFQIEVLHNELRKKAISIVKATAACDFHLAMHLTDDYLNQLDHEEHNAEQAILITEELITGQIPALPAISLPSPNTHSVSAAPLHLTRKQAADYLHVTIDTLRNWELNGLLTIKRKQNGYRIYTDEDIRQLIIIKSLRCANYSLAAILRMLTALTVNPDANIRKAIDSSHDDDIISACDHLLTALSDARTNARQIKCLLENIIAGQNNPPL